MMGIDYRENRLRMEQSMDAIMHLFSSDEPLTMDCGWFKIVDGVLNYKTYQRPHPPIAVAAVSSPGGPRIAGKYGLPLLSMTGQDDANIATLAEHWRVMETRAAEFGTIPADRSQWRLVGPMHIAETREQAEKDVEFGLEEWMAYFFRSRDYFKVYDGDGAEIPQCDRRAEDPLHQVRRDRHPPRMPSRTSKGFRRRQAGSASSCSCSTTGQILRPPPARWNCSPST